MVGKQKNQFNYYYIYDYYLNELLNYWIIKKIIN